MKATISYKETERIIKIMELMGGEKEAVVDFTIAMKRAGDQILNSFRITTPSEQLVGKFAGTMTSEDTGFSFALKLKMFLELLGSILSYKESIFMEIENNQFFMGVENKTKISIPIVEKVMDEIEMKEDRLAYQLTLSSKDLEKLCQQGLYMAKDENEEDFKAAIFRFDMKHGVLRGYSSDTYGLAKASILFTTVRDNIKTDSPNAEKALAMVYAMDKRLEEYCSRQTDMSFEDYAVPVPVKSVKNILKLALTGDRCTLTGDEHHMYVLSSDSLTVYTLTLASGFKRAIFGDAIYENIPDIKLVVDTFLLKQGFSLMKKVIDTNLYDLTPVRLEVSATEIRLSIRQMEEGGVKIPLFEGEGIEKCEGKTWYLNPKYILPMLNTVNAEKVLLYLSKNISFPLLFGKGTVEDGFFDSVNAIFGINPDKK